MKQPLKEILTTVWVLIHSRYTAYLETHPNVKYLDYVLRHKWYVFQECRKYGLTWAGIVHDLSKFRPSEWSAYVDFFNRASGDPLEREIQVQGFKYSWNHHQKRNLHHWQYWVLINDSGSIEPQEMPLRYAKEMLADWRGAGKALGNPDTRMWYLENADKMRLHPKTRTWVENQLKIVYWGKDLHQGSQPYTLYIESELETIAHLPMKEFFLKGREKVDRKTNAEKQKRYK